MAITKAGVYRSTAGPLLAVALLGASAGLLAWETAQAQATHSPRDTSQGVVFHFGVVPAEIVEAHPLEHPERAMHKGATRGEKHLVLAIFDASSGRRIAQAEVDATVSLVGGPAVTKRLQPMSVADQPSFGEFFHMGSGLYRIRFQVKRAGSSTAVGEFEYRVPG